MGWVFQVSLRNDSLKGFTGSTMQDIHAMSIRCLYI